MTPPQPPDAALSPQQKKSPPSGCGSGWGLGVSVCVRRNHVPELRLRLRNPVPIYYRITAKKLCFSYEQFVNYRAAGPNAPAAPFFVCIWKRCKGSWRERGNCREVGAFPYKHNSRTAAGLVCPAPAVQQNKNAPCPWTEGDKLSRYHLMFAASSRNAASRRAITRQRGNGRTRSTPTEPKGRLGASSTV